MSFYDSGSPDSGGFYGSTYRKSGGGRALQKKYEELRALMEREGVLEGKDEGLVPDELENFLYRTADLLARPNYAVAGMVDVALGNDERWKDTSFAERALYIPVRAFNELFSGVGRLKGDKEFFGEVLEEAGVPEWGRLSDLTGEDTWLKRKGFDPTTRGVLGLALDFRFDPLLAVGRGTAGALKVMNSTGDVSMALNPKGINHFNRLTDKTYKQHARRLGVAIGEESDEWMEEVAKRLARDDEWVSKHLKALGADSMELSADPMVRMTQVRRFVQEEAVDRLARMKARGKVAGIEEPPGLRFRPTLLPFTPHVLDIPLMADQWAGKAGKAMGGALVEAMKGTKTGTRVVRDVSDFLQDVDKVFSRVPYLAKAVPGYKKLQTEYWMRAQAAEFTAGYWARKILQDAGVPRKVAKDKAWISKLYEVIEAPLAGPEKAKLYSEFLEMSSKLGVKNGGRLLTDIQAAMYDMGVREQTVGLLKDGTVFVERAMPSGTKVKTAQGSEWGRRYLPRTSRLTEKEAEKVNAYFRRAGVTGGKMTGVELGAYGEMRTAPTHAKYVQAMTDLGYEDKIVWDLFDILRERMRAHNSNMLRLEFITEVAARYDIRNNSKVKALIELLKEKRAMKLTATETENTARLKAELGLMEDAGPELSRANILKAIDDELAASPEYQRMMRTEKQIERLSQELEHFKVEKQKAAHYVAKRQAELLQRREEIAEVMLNVKDLKEDLDLLKMFADDIRQGLDDMPMDAKYYDAVSPLGGPGGVWKTLENPVGSDLPAALKEELLSPGSLGSPETMAKLVKWAHANLSKPQLRQFNESMNALMDQARRGVDRTHKGMGLTWFDAVEGWSKGGQQQAAHTAWRELWGDDFVLDEAGGLLTWLETHGAWRNETKGLIDKLRKVLVDESDVPLQITVISPDQLIAKWGEEVSSFSLGSRHRGPWTPVRERLNKTRSGKNQITHLMDYGEMTPQTSGRYLPTDHVVMLRAENLNESVVLHELVHAALVRRTRAFEGLFNNPLYDAADIIQIKNRSAAGQFRLLERDAKWLVSGQVERSRTPFVVKGQEKAFLENPELAAAVMDLDMIRVALRKARDTNKKAEAYHFDLQGGEYGTANIQEFLATILSQHDLQEALGKMTLSDIGLRADDFASTLGKGETGNILNLLINAIKKALGLGSRETVLEEILPRMARVFDRPTEAVAKVRPPHTQKEFFLSSRKRGAKKAGRQFKKMEAAKGQPTKEIVPPEPKKPKKPRYYGQQVKRIERFTAQVEAAHAWSRQVQKTLSEITPGPEHQELRNWAHRISSHARALELQLEQAITQRNHWTRIRRRIEAIRSARGYLQRSTEAIRIQRRRADLELQRARNARAETLLLKRWARNELSTAKASLSGKRAVATKRAKPERYLSADPITGEVIEKVRPGKVIREGKPREPGQKQVFAEMRRKAYSKRLEENRRLLKGMRPSVQAALMYDALREVHTIKGLGRVFDTFSDVMDKMGSKEMQEMRALFLDEDKLSRLRKKVADNPKDPVAQEALDIALRKSVTLDYAGQPLVSHEFTKGPLKGRVLDLPEGIIKDFENFDNRWLANPEVKSLLHVWDLFTNTFKLNVTKYFPSFNSRNAYSNVFASAIDIGLQAFNPALHFEALRILMAGDPTIRRVLRGNGLGWLVDGTFKTYGGRRVPYQQMARELQGWGVNVDRMLLLDMTGRATGLDIPVKLFHGIARTTKGRVSEAASSAIRLTEFPSMIENEARALHYIALRRRGFAPANAAAQMNRFLFDYSDLSAAERNVLRRLVPFYTWTRKNVQMQIDNLINRPGAVAKQTKLLTQERGPEADALPDYVRGTMSVGFDRDDKGRTWLYGIDIPVANMDVLWAGSVGRTIREHIAMINPFIKMPFEIASGHSTFDMSSIRGQKWMGRLGPAIDRNWPQAMKDWLELRKVPLRDGGFAYRANAAKMYTLSTAMILGRLFSEGATTDEILSGFGDGDIEAGSLSTLRLLTGLRVESMNMDEMQKAMLRNRLRRAEEVLIEKGHLAEFTKSFVPGGKKKVRSTKQRGDGFYGGQPQRRQQQSFY